MEHVETTLPETAAMPLVKVRERAQITLPAEVRRALGIGKGDYLETEVTSEGILLKPVTVMDKETAWNRLTEAMNTVRYTGAGPEPSEDEVMDMVVDIIKEDRRKRRESRS